MTRAMVTARRAALQAELLEAMRAVERYRGALAVLDELLLVPDPAPEPDAAGRPLEAVA
jgi:hypothetical protein